MIWFFFKKCLCRYVNECVCSCRWMYGHRWRPEDNLRNAARPGDSTLVSFLWYSAVRLDWLTSTLQGSSCFCLASAQSWDCKCTSPHPVGSGGSGPHTCKASALPIKEFPTLVIKLKKIYSYLFILWMSVNVLPAYQCTRACLVPSIWEVFGSPATGVNR